MIRPMPDPAQHQLVQRCRQQGPGKLAPCVEDLLGNQRVATGSLRDEEEERRRGSLALVHLDERPHLLLAKRPEIDPGDAPGPALDGLQGRPKRMRPRQCVGLIRPDEEQRQMPCRSGQEGHEIARRRVDHVEILEEQDDRSVGCEPAQQAAQRLEGPLRSAAPGSRGCPPRPSARRECQRRAGRGAPRPDRGGRPRATAPASADAPRGRPGRAGTDHSAMPAAGRCAGW